MSSATTRFLDPRVLARIDRLDLLARGVVDGFVAGLHASAHLGVSTDFAEHRPYMPGDDIRRIDWRLFGRSERLYVKEFEAETHADVSFLIDISASMSFASPSEHETPNLSKLDYARYLAACLAYFSHRQRDRVGVMTFDRDIVDQIPASGRQIDRLLHVIDRATAGGAGELARPLRRISEGLRRRGIVVLISDLYEEPLVARRAIHQLTLAGHDVIVFHVLDPLEIDFDLEAPRQLEDLETGERIPVVPERIGASYRKLMAEHLQSLSEELGAARIDYCQITTSRPLDHALFDYLSRRQMMRKVR